MIPAAPEFQFPWVKQGNEETKTAIRIEALFQHQTKRSLLSLDLNKTPTQAAAIPIIIPANPTIIPWLISNHNEKNLLMETLSRLAPPKKTIGFAVFVVDR